MVNIDIPISNGVGVCMWRLYVDLMFSWLTQRDSHTHDVLFDQWQHIFRKRLILNMTDDEKHGG